MKFYTYSVKIAAPGQASTTVECDTWMQALNVSSSSKKKRLSRGAVIEVREGRRLLHRYKKGEGGKWQSKHGRSR